MDCVDAGGYTPLNKAIVAVAARSLRLYRCNLMTSNQVLLNIRLPLVEALLERADPNLANGGGGDGGIHGFSPLHTAARFNLPDVVEMLLEKAANTNARIAREKTTVPFFMWKTPLMLAAQ